MMTVAQLIKKLTEFPFDMEVKYRSDLGPEQIDFVEQETIDGKPYVEIL